VTVGVESRAIKGKEYNVIYVHDTGPGIPSHIIPKLFGDFFTSGKKEGTGLGLAFCKRNMKIFGGDIIVQSEPAKDGKSGWTKFSLLFPKLTEEEIKSAETIAKRRKALIVDDQETNLTATKLKIEQNLKNIICDIALGGKEAINLAKVNKYHLILMDIQMPEINGIKAAKEIRKFNKDIPIIAFTSLCYQSFLKEAGSELNDNDFNYCLNKSAPNNILYRTITKWITDINDDFSYLGNREEYQTSLQNKNILLADDQKINLMMIKRNLEKNGAIVTEAVDGKELLEIYKNSLDEEGKSNFDMIITDIHMPPYDGDEAAKEIRVIELGNNLKYKNIIPIIAISGDGRKEDIYHFFNSGITDYFIKGSDSELLLKVVASYLIRKDNKIIESQIENKQSASKLDEIIYEKIIHQILDLNKISFFGQEDQKTIMELFVKEGNKIIALIIPFQLSN
jgi:two-component system CAI-1 autoinducer sensor kinase/phosphatase CqsS